jgi:hypothetical protein
MLPSLEISTVLLVVVLQHLLLDEFSAYLPSSAFLFFPYQNLNGDLEFVLNGAFFFPLNQLLHLKSVQESYDNILMPFVIYTSRGS